MSSTSPTDFMFTCGLLRRLNHLARMTYVVQEKCDTWQLPCCTSGRRIRLDSPEHFGKRCYLWQAAIDGFASLHPLDWLHVWHADPALLDDGNSRLPPAAQL